MSAFRKLSRSGDRPAWARRQRLDSAETGASVSLSAGEHGGGRVAFAWHCVRTLCQNYNLPACAIFLHATVRFDDLVQLEHPSNLDMQRAGGHLS